MSSYFVPCACGGEVRVERKADLQICAACDRANRFIVLHLAMLVHDFDLRTSELLVKMTGFDTELSDGRGAEARKRSGAEIGKEAGAEGRT